MARSGSASGHAHQPHAGIDVPCAPAGCLGDVTGAGQSEHADRHVAEGRHDPRAILAPDLASVFVEGHVAYPMQPVLDRPVTPHQPQKLLRCLPARTSVACEAVDDFCSRGASVEFRDVTFQAEDDLGVGEVEVPLQVFTQPDPAGLDSAVSLVVGTRLREKKSPTPPPRCRRATWVGCPSR